jgi:hypothetical protein
MGAMADYREESSFVVRVSLGASFDDDYEGDDDGFAWLERWRAQVRPKLARAVADALRSDAAFEVTPASRGKSPDDELELTVELRRPPPRAPATPTPAGAARGAS